MTVFDVDRKERFIIVVQTCGRQSEDTVPYIPLGHKLLHQYPWVANCYCPGPVKRPQPDEMSHRENAPGVMSLKIHLQAHLFFLGGGVQTKMSWCSPLTSQHSR